MDISKRAAEILASTSVQNVNNQILEDTYKANKAVLRGVMWISTLDLRTTFSCAVRDQGCWDFDGNPLPESKVKFRYPGPPPAHSQCRCVISPLTKSWDHLIAEAGGKSKGPIVDIAPTVRASMDGPVLASLTYEDWLKTKSVAEQKQVLGDEKWRLWSEERLTFQQMVDHKGNPLTLRELMAKIAAMRR